MTIPCGRVTRKQEWESEFHTSDAIRTEPGYGGLAENSGLALPRNYRMSSARGTGRPRFPAARSAPQCLHWRNASSTARRNETGDQCHDHKHHWDGREDDQIERWVGSGLLVAERQFRKVIGFRQIPLLLSSMANAVSKKPIAKRAAVA